MSRNMPPGDLDVGDRRGRRIAADDVHQVRRSDLAAGDRLPDAREVRIEAAVEADLQFHPGLVHSGQCAIDAFEVWSIGFSQKMCFPASAA